MTMKIFNTDILFITSTDSLLGVDSFHGLFRAFSSHFIRMTHLDIHDIFYNTPKKFLPHTAILDLFKHGQNIIFWHSLACK